jgi:hypothetical protein
MAEKEKVKETDNLNYRNLAELVLQRFGLSKVEDLSDEELIMEFSKMSDVGAVFDTSVNYPSGSLMKARPTTRVDGIIWANKHCPEFIKVAIPDEDWLGIWRKERLKKVNTEKFVQEAFTTDKLIEKIVFRDKEFSEQKIKNNETVYKINIYELLNVLKEEYDKAIIEGLNATIPSPVDILNLIAEMNYFNDFSDMIAKAEQEIHNNKKISYIEYTETENIDLSEIINDFDDDDDDDDEDVFNDDDDENDEDSLFDDDDDI